MAGEPTGGVLSGYDPGGYYCEMTGGGTAAAHTARIRSRLADLLVEDLRPCAGDAPATLGALCCEPDARSIDEVIPMGIRRCNDGIRMRLDSVSDEMPYAFFGVLRPASVAAARSQARTGA